MKKILILALSLSLMNTGCTADKPISPVVSAEHSIPSLHKIQTSSSHQIQQLLYDSYSDKIYALHSDKTSTLFYVIDSGQAATVPSFIIPNDKKYSYSHFQFDENGQLYAVRTSPQKKNQKLVQYNFFTKRFKKVPLTPMPTSPIVALQFSGSKIALVCQNRSVSFYNLIEGQQLGIQTLRAIPAHSALYHEHFFTQTFDSTHHQNLCKDIDFRTGDCFQTYPLISDSHQYIKVPMYINRETLYLLRQNKLFSGTIGSNILNKLVELDNLLPHNYDVDSIIVTSNNTIYFTGHTNAHQPAFYQYQLTPPEQSPKNQVIRLS